jgi:protein-S-isoprenylcysteine O-methyltransferase Ste14
MLPPPLMFGVAFGISALLQHFVPLSFVAGVKGVYLAGAIFMTAGVCMGLYLAVTFLLRRTTLNPFAEPSAFVAQGPYRLSRNPMYLSLIITYLGAALDDRVRPDLVQVAEGRRLILGRRICGVRSRPPRIGAAVHATASRRPAGARTSK